MVVSSVETEVPGPFRVTTGEAIEKDVKKTMAAYREKYEKTRSN